MRFLCVIAATFCSCLFPQQLSASLDETIQSAISEHSSDTVMAYARVDLNDDGTIEIVVITSEGTEEGHPVGGEIIVLKEIHDELQVIWRQEGFNPWKLEIGDVDGDGPMEIVVGVWKTSPFDPVMANRVFVYSWDGEEVQPKWLGSRLVRRFDDFVLCDINSDGWDELIDLEVTESGEHQVAVYRWDIFGFEWLGCSDEMDGIRCLSVEDGVPYAVTISDQFRINLFNDQVEIETSD